MLAMSQHVSVPSVAVDPTPPDVDAGGSLRGSAGAPSTPSVDAPDVSRSAPTPSGKAGTSAPSVGGLRTDLGAGTKSLSVIGAKADNVVADAPAVTSAHGTKPKRGLFVGIFGSSKGKPEVSRRALAGVACSEGLFAAPPIPIIRFSVFAVRPAGCKLLS